MTADAIALLLTGQRSAAPRTAEEVGSPLA
jgi:hypothetical protein